MRLARIVSAKCFYYAPIQQCIAKLLNKQQTIKHIGMATAARRQIRWPIIKNQRRRSQN